VSVIGTDAQQKLAVEALNHAAGRIQAELAGHISLRSLPTLEFLTDKRFKGALRTWEIIRQAMDELEETRRRREAEAESRPAGTAADKDDDEPGEAP